MDSSRLQKLLHYLRPHWKPTALGTGALFLVNALGVYIPLLIRNSIDELQTSFSFELILRYVFFILILATIMWVIRVASRMWIFGVGRQVEFDLKQRIFEHLLTLEMSYFAENRIGDTINRSTSDVDNIRRLVGFAVLSLVNTLFAYILTLPVMLAIDLRLTLLSLLIYPVMFVVVWLASDRLRTEQLTLQEKLSDMSGTIQEDMSGMALIKIYSQEENERRAFSHLNRDVLKANLDLARTRTILFPLLQGLASGSLLILLAFGSGAIANGRIDIGDFVALILYVERLVFPTALLGFTLTIYQRGEVSIDRIEAIFTVKPKIRDTATSESMPVDDVRGKIEARHLTYRYGESEDAALNDLSFEIFPGETVAIVGAIGSGKSTLVQAFPRLLDIAPGQLFLDGIDITQIRIEDLRRAIAFVPQDSFLFSTTIQNNIRYGVPLTSLKEIEPVAEQAQIHAEIFNFPQQYETIVGERGITLSGGQRQRTSLARALLIDAPILILDDALSSVDNQTATDILKNLSTQTQRKTVIFISHQMSAAATADRIFVMERGKIVQTGTHAELIGEKGLYQSLWEIQKFEELLI
ncbi:ABC transporter ATP-binding protein [Oscillatoriales cyanobacterium LEGE 11467]|uniref:ABC transporter ATP-binding protein n=1 Tax=Zarconia navalis LEGE 11467 TaxID=1828826 RepID=A0A928VXL5_9CYAN|nr:ABC transporter ATP-binding protein [Zarconia navalis]MBE9039540.1 ABC transporter ATP-binding protein [Zarconia navalis LEGE 11467]